MDVSGDYFDNGMIDCLAGRLGACGEPDVPRRLDLLLAECQEALIFTVNPAVVLDRLATRAYLWLRR